MIRCAIKVATLAALFQTAEAHVRAIPTGMGCRTCNGKASPGPYSTSGPLGGNTAFANNNNVNVVNEGQEVTISIGYNGGHKSATLNYFNVRYVCGTQAASNQNNFKKVGSSDKNTINCQAPCKQLTAAQIKTVGGQAATAQNYPIDATQSLKNGYTVTFQIPKIEGTGDQRKCTFAMVEGRDWGAGWDFDIQAVNANPGGGVVAPPPTQPPPAVKSMSGTYTFSTANCLKDAPNCACLTGGIVVNHAAGAKTATALVTVTNYPPKIIEMTEKIPGALSVQYLLSNCASQTDQLMDINLSPLGTTQGSLNVGIIDDFPKICGALVKTNTQPTTLTPAGAILQCNGCLDVANWKDTDGDTCAQYASCKNGDWRTKDISHYQKYQAQGLTALDACCECGGGQGKYGKATEGPAGPAATTKPWVAPTQPKPIVGGGTQPPIGGGTQPPNDDQNKQTAPGGTTRTNSLFGSKVAASDPAQAVGVAAGAVLTVIAAMSM